jgi:cytochrome c biogenesis protein CcdA/thiol-disulfide isomerase/thioredoxin
VVLLLAFALIGGALTILSPCTLPVVPLMLGTAGTGGRRRTTGILLGFGGTFVAATVLLASVLAAAGLTTDALRFVSALLLAAFGLTLAVPMLGRWFERRATSVASIGSSVATRGSEPGLAGGLVLGGAIGLVWAPCVGPIMAAVVASAVVAGPSVPAVAIAIAYVAGVSLPLLAIARWGRAAVAVIGRPRRRAMLQQSFGVLTVAAAIAVATRFDIAAQTALADVLPPGWSGAIVALEQQPAVQEELDMFRTGPDNTAADSTSGVGVEDPRLPPPVSTTLGGSVLLEDDGPASELRGITDWINSEPLTVASLRGKVVLVHFWTFGCINCIHVQPYVKAWYERYSQAGFVVLGVHTPELSFERDIANVRDAVAKAEVRFPVAFDPNFATWNAYRNSYWPAFYFVDKTGRIRHVHFGEGDYDGSEQVIRELLSE